MIRVLPELLCPETVRQAQQLLAGLAESDWADGRDSAGAQARQVKTNLQLPHEHPVAALTGRYHNLLRQWAQT